MSAPNDYITSLDRANLAAGEDIVLKRLEPGSNPPAYRSVTCRATVRGMRPEEVIGTIKLTDVRVIISPTEIDRASWPGLSTGKQADKPVPMINDKVIVKGREMQVSFVDLIYVAGAWVRANLIASG